MTAGSKLFHQGVIQPLVESALRTGSLDGLDLCSLSCVCKDALGCIDWEGVRVLALKHNQARNAKEWKVHLGKGPCMKCERDGGIVSLSGEKAPNICFYCRGIISVSEAKRLYHLSDADVQHFPRLLLRGRYTWQTAIDHRSVRSFALLRYGGPEGLEQAMLPKRITSLACQRRLKEVLELVETSHSRTKRRSALWNKGSKETPMTRFLLLPQPTRQYADKYIRTGVQDHLEKLQHSLNRLVHFKSAWLSSAEWSTAQYRDVELRIAKITRRLYKKGDFSAASVDLGAYLAEFMSNGCADFVSDEQIAQFVELAKPLDGCVVDHIASKCPVDRRWSHHKGLLQHKGHIQFELDDLQDLLSDKSKPALRQNDLQETLRDQGLDIRSDSRLCRAYIQGVGKSLQWICAMMVEMKWFANKTSYAETRERLKAASQDLTHITLSSKAKGVVLQAWAHRAQDVPEMIRNNFRLIFSRNN